MVGVEKMSVELASDSIQIPSRDDENNIHDQCDENNLNHQMVEKAQPSDGRTENHC